MAILVRTSLVEVVALSCYSRAGRPGAEGRPLGAVEKPRSVDRPPAGQARRDPEDEPAAVSRLPAQGAAAGDLPAAATDAIALLDRWIAWARRCRLAPFVRLARTLTAHWNGIAAAVLYGLSNARIEAANTRIRLIARRAFGFHTPDALIALAQLTLGGYCPPLPGR